MPKHLMDIVYLASEILPGSLFFVVVIVADIQFTAGYIQGFVVKVAHTNLSGETAPTEFYM